MIVRNMFDIVSKSSLKYSIKTNVIEYLCSKHLCTLHQLTLETVYIAFERAFFFNKKVRSKPDKRWFYGR